jgi:hypothetical protein
MQEIEIDENIKELVELMNTLPGIHTSSCCGGHKNPTVGQNKEDTFNVTFNVAFNKQGRKSLGIITWSVQQACLVVYGQMADMLSKEQREWLLEYSYTVMPVYLGDFDHYNGCLDFSLDGQSSVPIELLVNILRAEIEYQKLP